MRVKEVSIIIIDGARERTVSTISIRIGADIPPSSFGQLIHNPSL